MRKVNLLDRRWTKIEPGAQADCGAMQNSALSVTQDPRKVTCGSCLRIISNKKAA